MLQQVKHLLLKPDLSSIPRTHMKEEGRSWQFKTVFQCSDMLAHPIIYTNDKKIKIKNINIHLFRTTKNASKCHEDENVDIS